MRTRIYRNNAQKQKAYRLRKKREAEAAARRTFEDAASSWKDEWKGMPEFVQEQVRPHATVILRFADAAAMEEFSKLIGQDITKGKVARGIWHPKLVAGNVHMQSNKRYVNESKS